MGLTSSRKNIGEKLKPKKYKQHYKINTILKASTSNSTYERKRMLIAYPLRSFVNINQKENS